MSERELLVLAKEPRPGAVKTRLAKSAGISPRDAARIAEALLRDTLRAAARVAARRTVCHDPPESRAWFAALDPEARLEAQPAGDLGARLAHAFRSAFARGAHAAAAIGTDAPHAGAARIVAAYLALEEADVALGPARDGGYWLVALKARCEKPECNALFADIPWSTPRVLRVTLERARELGLRVSLLDELDDVDEAADLERLARSLAPDGEPCPNLARVLRELGRAPFTA